MDIVIEAIFDRYQSHCVTAVDSSIVSLVADERVVIIDDLNRHAPIRRGIGKAARSDHEPSARYEQQSETERSHSGHSVAPELPQCFVDILTLIVHWYCCTPIEREQ
jgi:hypothetical protein